MTFFVPGNVFSYTGTEPVMQGQHCVVVWRAGTAIESDGTTVVPTIRKFILFENGERRTVMSDWVESLKLIGRISPERALRYDQSIPIDPTVPAKHKPHLIRIVL